MAVDEAILEHVERGQALPTLRLYAWDPPCLSLGYAQSFAEVDRAALEREGWQVVRRPTGGRAILHTDELTYAVIGPSSDPRLRGSVLESYRRLSQALIRALQELGVAVQVQEETLPGGTSTNPMCFEVPSAYEITVFGKKLIGSAQARRREGVLQHGSLPLYGDLARITRGLRFPNEEARQEAARRLRQRATTLEEALGHRLEWEEVAQTFVRAFEQTFDLHFLIADLQPSERQRAAALVAEKYAHPSWLERL